MNNINAKSIRKKCYFRRFDEYCFPLESRDAIMVALLSSGGVKYCCNIFIQQFDVRVITHFTFFRKNL